METLTEVLITMRDELVDEFMRESKKQINITEADKVSLAKKIKRRDKQKLQESIYMGQPLTAADHRTKAEAHQERADELKAGEKKDNHLAAAQAHEDAADAIDAAHKSSRKAELSN